MAKAAPAEHDGYAGRSAATGFDTCCRPPAQSDGRLQGVESGQSLIPPGCPGGKECAAARGVHLIALPTPYSPFYPDIATGAEENAGQAKKPGFDGASHLFTCDTCVGRSGGTARHRA